MTQAGHETNTGNAEATAASGVMAHQYELMVALKAEAEKLNARYNLAYDAINDALPLHPICRANKFTGEAHYWNQFEETAHLRMNPLAPNFDHICEKIRRQYDARERARKDPDLQSLVEKVNEADARWTDIEAQIMDAEVFTVGTGFSKACWFTRSPRRSRQMVMNG